MQGQKICPTCRTLSLMDAQFCARCGHKFKTQFPPNQTQAFIPPSALAPPPTAPLPPNQQWIGKPKGRHDILLVMVASLFIPGGGQFVNGQIGKGFLCALVGIIACVLTVGLAAVVVIPALMVDAYLIARKLNAGHMVRVYEWF